MNSTQLKLVISKHIVYRNSFICLYNLVLQELHFTNRKLFREFKQEA